MGGFSLLTFYRYGKSKDDVGIMPRIGILASKDNKRIPNLVCGKNVNSDIKGHKVF